jgi:hypothetical protein
MSLNEVRIGIRDHSDYLDSYRFHLSSIREYPDDLFLVQADHALHDAAFPVWICKTQAVT